MNDERIISLYWARDEQAIAQTKEKYGKYLLTIAYNVLNCREDAEECENDTYLAAWNTMPPNRPSLLSAFLGKITRNLSLKRLRTKTADKRGGGEALLSLDELGECIPTTASFDESLELRALADSLNAFLYALDELERNVFICRYFYCDSIADLCRQFGLGESRVKMMLLRTRKKLLSHLQKEGVFV